nr:MAG TPA: hypothetical protein [Caudoviricetes sp.]
MDLVRKRIDEEFANSEYWVTKHIICDLEMKDYNHGFSKKKNRRGIR